MERGQILQKGGVGGLFEIDGYQRSWTLLPSYVGIDADITVTKDKYENSNKWCWPWASLLQEICSFLFDILLCISVEMHPKNMNLENYLPKDHPVFLNINSLSQWALAKKNEIWSNSLVSFHFILFISKSIFQTYPKSSFFSVFRKWTTYFKCTIKCRINYLLLLLCVNVWQQNEQGTDNKTSSDKRFCTVVKK